MLYAQFRERFLAMVEEVEKHPDIIVKSVNKKFRLLNDTQIQNIRNRIKEDYSFDVPEPYVPFIFPSRLTLIWHFEFDQGDWIGAGGSFSLLNLQTALINPLETSLYKKGKIEITGEDAALYRQSFRFFDQHTDGTADMASFKFEPSATVLPVYWVSWPEVLRKGPIPLELDYRGYMEHILKTRGMINWQYLFSDVRFDDMDFNLEESLEESFEAMQRLFPNDDFSEYLDRFEKLKKR